MGQLLEQFLHGTDPMAVMNAAVALASQDHDPDPVPALLGALHDPLEDRRWGAVYALGFSRIDRRAAVPLIDVLGNRRETVRVRSQSAECLGYMRFPRAIKPLIRASRDPSPDLRFWSVFALGQIDQWQRRRLTRAGIRALEARLDDYEKPVEKGWWPVRFEALASLEGKTGSATRECRELIHQVLADPLAHQPLWHWASFYSQDATAIAAAAERITAAGHDPSTFGRGFATALS